MCGRRNLKAEVFSTSTPSFSGAGASIIFNFKGLRPKVFDYDCSGRKAANLLYEIGNSDFSN
jgi:hypothetical protein